MKNDWDKFFGPNPPAESKMYQPMTEHEKLAALVAKQTEALLTQSELLSFTSWELKLLRTAIEDLQSKMAQPLEKPNVPTPKGPIDWRWK